MWGYIYRQGIAPVYIGEFGTKLTDPKDPPWLEAITSYLAGDLDSNGTTDMPAGDKGVSWTFWSWNPNSGDTGGILANDWRTVNQNKMAYLTPIQFDFDSDVSDGGRRPACDFVVTLSAPATETVTVDYHTVAGTAGSADFTGASGTVTFAPGETSKTITIAITPDTLVEGNEQFTVVLSNPPAPPSPTAPASAPSSTTTPRRRGLPTLAIGDASVTEGDSGTSQPPSRSTLSQAASGPVTVNYATANGTATAGSDYTARAARSPSPPARPPRPSTSPITGDTAVEANETFTVSPGGRLRRHHRRRLGHRHHRQQRRRAADPRATSGPPRAGQFLEQRLQRQRHRAQRRQLDVGLADRDRHAEPDHRHLERQDHLARRQRLCDRTGRVERQARA